MSKKIAFIGAGSFGFTRSLVRDILSFEAFHDATIALMDIDPERLDYIYRACKRIAEEGKYPATIIATRDRTEALTGADGVVTTILHGAVDVWQHDILIPKKYGVDTNVGDTRGPSGIFRYLRTVNPILEIAADIERYCPNAVYLNYTNPMAMLCRTVQSEFPHLTTSGLCHSVQGTADRTGLWRAQTPQGFRYEAILAAHRAHSGGAADDVEVARDAGLSVAIVTGDEDNLKLTFAPDFARAEALIKRRDMDIRMGNGYDVHAFTEGDHLWLCGVRLPHGRGLLGHSDADVGMHALTDAIYGALAEGDIGRHFPPSDPQWKGAASHIFLRHAIELARSRGYQLSNCDVTLVCERPKIGPHALDMQAELARIMQIEMGRISVKATTSERLGFTGREEGIAALATAVLVKA